jgi:hypothetical protein
VFSSLFFHVVTKRKYFASQRPNNLTYRTNVVLLFLVWSLTYTIRFCRLCWAVRFMHVHIVNKCIVAWSHIGPSYRCASSRLTLRYYQLPAFGQGSSPKSEYFQCGHALPTLWGWFFPVLGRLTFVVPGHQPCL